VPGVGGVHDRGADASNGVLIDERIVWSDNPRVGSPVGFLVSNEMDLAHVPRLRIYTGAIGTRPSRARDQSTIAECSIQAAMGKPDHEQPKLGGLLYISKESRGPKPKSGGAGPGGMAEFPRRHSPAEDFAMWAASLTRDAVTL
jgi:hypothetical protein